MFVQETALLGFKTDNFASVYLCHFEPVASSLCLFCVTVRRPKAYRDLKELEWEMQGEVKIKTEARLPGFESAFHHSRATWAWTTLFLCFRSVSKMGIRGSTVKQQLMWGLNKPLYIKLL